MSPILRVPNDVGRLTNRRMGLELAVGMAALGGRRLSMPWSEPIGSAPAPRFDGRPRPTMTDLWEVPVEVVTEDEWADTAGVARLDWPPLTECVYLADPDPIPHLGLHDFANGRTVFVRLPDTGEALELTSRPLGWWSYFFHATGATRRRLRGVLDGVRVRAPYVDLAERIARDLGVCNVAHVRRTDMVVGIRAYAGVSPRHIARSLAAVLPTDEPLVVASEADPASSLFDPLRDTFADVVFLNDVILRDHADGFAALPFQEDNALGVVTQEVAARATRFVGTVGSTFTGLIQRLRLQRDGDEPFLYTADYTPEGPVFRKGRYRDRRPGRYSWNRIGYAMSPDVLSWIREWPEAVASPDDEPADGDARPGGPPIHAVVCTDTNPYGDWQCRFQEHTWRRAAQPGELVRLIATPNGEKAFEHGTARVVTTRATNAHPRTGGAEYAGYNRLWSLQEWLERERPRGSILILDADFAFRGPISSVAAPGVIVAQQWWGFGVRDAVREALGAVGVAGIDSLPPLTWPLLIDAGDLRAVLPRWLELTAELRLRTDAWESDMLALCAVVAEAGLQVRYETLGAWMNWPEAFVAGAPIVHYCQAVEGRDGSVLWWKQTYRPWEALGFDPDAAKLDYVRDFLRLLDEFQRLQAGG